MPLNRSWLNGLVDDSGAGLDGTVWNKLEIGLFHDVIDAALLPLESVAGIPPHAATHAPGGSDPLTGSYATLAGANTFAGAQTVLGDLVLPNSVIRTASVDGADTSALNLSGGGGFGSGRGATFSLFGNEYAGVDSASAVVTLGFNPAAAFRIQAPLGSPSLLQVDQFGVMTPLTLTAAGLGTTPLDASQLLTGTVPNARLSAAGANQTIQFNDAGSFAGEARLRYDKTGDGVLWLPRTLGFEPPAGVMAFNTPPGADTGTLYLTAAGGPVPRGGTITLSGNESIGTASPGSCFVYLGTAAGAQFTVVRAAGTAILSLDSATGALSIQGDIFAQAASFTDLTTTPLNASQLLSGTVPDARLTANVLKVAGGFPGGTANFLRADGTFAAPPAGGGSGDVVGPASSVNTDLALFNGTTGKLISDSGVTIAQVVKTNVNNTLTGTTNTISHTTPQLAFHETDQGTDLKQFRIVGDTGTLQVRAVSDAGATLTTPLTITRAGNVTVLGTLTADGGNRALTVAGGFPGGTVNFLRADGTFQPPPTGGVPSAHATTHQPGGADPMAVDAAAGTGSLRTLGTTATSAAAGNDARLTDARTPTAHASTHNAGGSDPLTALSAAILTTGTLPDGRFPATLPAVSGANLTTLNATNLTAGTVANARLTADVLKVTAGFPGGATNFLRADGIFAAPIFAPAGVTTQIQFNDGGVLAGDAGLTYDKTGDHLTLNGSFFVAQSTGNFAAILIPNTKALAWRNGGNTDYLYPLTVDVNNALQVGSGCAYQIQNTVIYASPDATHDLGAGSLRFRDGYFSRQVYAGGVTFATSASVVVNTTDGADSAHLYLTGSGAPDQARGAYLDLTGNESGFGGSAIVKLGTVAGSSLQVWLGSGSQALLLDAQGAVTLTTIAAAMLTLNCSAANGGYITFNRSGTACGYIGNAATMGFAGTNNDFAVYAPVSTAKLYLEANGGSIRSSTMYNDVTGTGAANVVVESDGRVRRVSSSRRYKTGIEPLRDWRWFLELAAVEFADARTPQGRKMGGFTAEDVAARGPLRNGAPIFAGLNDAGEPDDVAYANLVAVIQLGLKEFDRRLAALERAA